MKPGDLVRFKGTLHVIEGHRPEAEKYGMFLGYKTFDKNYTCSEVLWYPENKVRPVQSDLIEVVK